MQALGAPPLCSGNQNGSRGSGRSLGGQWSSGQRASELRVPTQWAEAHSQDVSPFVEAGASTRNLPPSRWLMVLIGVSSSPVVPSPFYIKVLKEL